MFTKWSVVGRFIVTMLLGVANAIVRTYYLHVVAHVAHGPNEVVDWIWVG